MYSVLSIFCCIVLFLYAPAVEWDLECLTEYERLQGVGNEYRGGHTYQGAEADGADGGVLRKQQRAGHDGQDGGGEEDGRG